MTELKVHYITCTNAVDVLHLLYIPVLYRKMVTPGIPVKTVLSLLQHSEPSFSAQECTVIGSDRLHKSGPAHLGIEQTPTKATNTNEKFE